MHDDTVTDNAAPVALSDEPNSPEPRWPAIAAFGLVWIRPATTSRRTQHASMPTAFGIHLLAILASFLAIIFLMSIQPFESRGFVRLIGEVIEEIVSDPFESFLAIALMLIGLEVGVLILTLVMLPFGAREEPLRQSFSYAWKRVWIHTTFTVPLVLIIGMIGTAAAYVGDWIDTMYPWPTWDSANAKSYDQKLQARIASMPFMVRNYAFFAANSIVASVMWYLWSLTRFVAARPHPEMVPSAPMCEYCGYNLSGTSREGRCSECGTFVVDSLGEHVRPGSPWQRRDTVGWFSAFRSGLSACFRPTQAGRSIRVHDTHCTSRLMLGTNLAIAYVMGTAWIMFVLWVAYGNDYGYFRDPILIMPGVLSGIVVAFMLGVTGLAATVVALYYAHSLRRNLAHTASLAASHTSGYIMLWAILGCVQIAIVTPLVEKGYYSVLRDMFHWDDEFLVFITYAGFHAGCALSYLVVIWKVTAAAKFANR